MYSDIVKEHALHPRNRGKMESPDLVGEGKFPRCGDKVKLYLSLCEGRIARASFWAAACGPTVAAASLATTLLEGLTLGQARQALVTDLPGLLRDLPASKRHAILVVLDCLAQILEQDQQNKNEGDRNV
jgi:nitrogen fixation NifU-like protein